MGALLLVPSGVWKIRKPLTLLRTLRAAHLPSSIPIVTAIGAVEIAVGVASLVLPYRAARLSLALLYACFAGFVVYALAQRLPLTSCGCTGTHESPPSLAHALGNVLVVAAALAAPAEISLPATIESAGVGAGTVYAAGIAASAFAVYLAYAFLPEHFGAYRKAGAPSVGHGVG